MKPNPRPLTPWILALSILALIPLSVAYGLSRFDLIPHALNALSASKSEPFPVIDLASLDPRQQALVAVLKQEYKLQPPGTKYSAGVSEPWCADFVSWVMKAAGQPLSNPNTGSWRIPGTYTLRQYYESVGKFRAPGSGYSPKIGDVMLYDNPSPFGQHVNIVIKNDHGLITTIGGNEPGGIRVFTHKTKDKAGFVGYGVF